MTTIAISSGKGGTGKTFISTNIAYMLAEAGNKVRYLDCDVEEPNGHLFLHPEISNEEDVSILSPSGIDAAKCIQCGKCADACNYNAIAVIKKKVLLYKNMCHICGACTIVCPQNAIVETDRKIGKMKHGRSGKIDFHYALLETAEGGMSPRLIKKVKSCIDEGINILDSPPGTACPVVETVRDADICVLVTDPTPFGINDLKLAVDMCREIGQEPVVLVNRAEYFDNSLKSYCISENLEIIGEIPDERKIAECYSVGGLAAEKFPAYSDIFKKIAATILKMADEKRPVIKISHTKNDTHNNIPFEKGNITVTPQKKLKELVVISGKGGTGKTSLTASFCALQKNIAIADCDVDAADLHIVLKPEIRDRGIFSGGYTAAINPDKCIACGLCFDKCRFGAVKYEKKNGLLRYFIDSSSCEGCGVCCLVCGVGAAVCTEAVNGEWYISDTRFGPMCHAKLGMAEENSGKLVTLVRNKKDMIGNQMKISEAVIDGSPGTGCPVIASVTGADYACVVTEPTVSGIHDLKRILDLTKFFNIKSGIIVNKHDINPAKSDEIKKIAAEYSSEFLGTISYDKSVTEAQMRGMSVVEYTENTITKEIKKIWETINAHCF